MLNKERRKEELHNIDTGTLYMCLVESIKPILGEGLPSLSMYFSDLEIHTDDNCCSTRYARDLQAAPVEAQGLAIC